MKTCPTCGARAFDDAEVCFGCLHRYEEEPVRPNVAMPTMPSSPGTGHCPTLRPKAAPAEPKAPPRDGAGWTVPVSYTHLDVYKRQRRSCRRAW